MRWTFTHLNTQIRDANSNELVHPMAIELLSGTQYILRKLSLMGVKHLFGIPGAHVYPLLFHSAGADMEFVINCHELSAGYMADGFGRASDTIGVLFGIGGPGSNNMVTAVNTARVERTPLLVITGDVPVRFATVPGFQSANHFGSNDDAIFKTITKYSKRVSTIDDLTGSLEEAIHTALTPPFGPAHLIVPYDVFTAATTARPRPTDPATLRYWKNDRSASTLSRISDLLLSDKKLTFWIGDSLNRTEQSKHIIRLAETFHVPVATSFSAKGVIPERHPLAIGNFGYAGSVLSKAVLLSQMLDGIIGFDIEQNERNTLGWHPDLYRDKELVLVNFPGSFSNKRYGESIDDNPFHVLQSLSASLKDAVYDRRPRERWFQTMIQNVDSKTTQAAISQPGMIEPGRLIQLVQEKMPRESVLFVDSGEHRIFAGQYWKAVNAASFYSASVMAPMGWALAAAIGCTFARKEPVIVFTGDGCMQMHGIELKTAVKYNKPLLVVVANNRAFGRLYRYLSKVSERAADMAAITEINWNLFGQSLGVRVFDIASEENLIQSIRQFRAEPKPTILNVSTPIEPYHHDITLTKSAFA
jgi:acetolactate synthase I/II/III large subunit